MLELLGVSHTTFGLDDLSIPSTVAFASHIPGIHQVVDDPLSCPFGDSHCCCNVSQAYIVIAVDRQEHLRVARQEVPPTMCFRT